MRAGRQVGLQEFDFLVGFHTTFALKRKLCRNDVQIQGHCFLKNLRVVGWRVLKVVDCEQLVLVNVSSSPVGQEELLNQTEVDVLDFLFASGVVKSDFGMDLLVAKVYVFPELDIYLREALGNAAIAMVDLCKFRLGLIGFELNRWLVDNQSPFVFKNRAV